VRNGAGHAVLRYKLAMSHTTWLPVGFHANDVSFAPRLLHDGVQSCSLFATVVPNVLPVQALSTFLSNNARSLRLVRAAIRFPEEPAGAALAWWETFLSVERARIEGQCTTCTRIQSELATIVIHQAKGKALAENTAKTARRKALQLELSTHECTDRAARQVLVTTSSLLRFFILRDPCASKRESVPLSASLIVPAAPSTAEVEMTSYREPSSGIALIHRSALPKAFSSREPVVRVGDFAIILHTSSPADWMGTHPFWLVRIVRMTNRRHWLHYYGPEFLKSYKGLHPPGQPKTDYVDEFASGSVTYIHWGFKLASNKIKVADLKVVSLDTRVPWVLPSSSSSSSSSSISSSSSSLVPVDSDEEEVDAGGEKKKEPEQRASQNQRAGKRPSNRDPTPATRKSARTSKSVHRPDYIVEESSEDTS